MGLIVAAIMAVAGVITAGVKEGTFANNTTRQDTIAFEKRALEDRLARMDPKWRNVIELSGGSLDQKLVKEAARVNQIEEKISRLEDVERQNGWNR